MNPIEIPSEISLATQKSMNKLEFIKVPMKSHDLNENIISEALSNEKGRRKESYNLEKILCNIDLRESIDEEKDKNGLKDENEEYLINQKGLRRMKIICDFEANRHSKKLLTQLSDIHHPDEGFYLIEKKIMHKILLDYDPHHIPPNWRLAENHGVVFPNGIYFSLNFLESKKSCITNKI